MLIIGGEPQIAGNPLDAIEHFVTYHDTTYVLFRTAIVYVFEIIIIDDSDFITGKSISIKLY